MSKSKYISFAELRSDYKLAEIFEFMQAGLQPLDDPSLLPIPCPPEHHRCTFLSFIINFFVDQYGEEIGTASNETIKKYEKEIKLVECEDPRHISWKYFQPPSHSELEREELEKLVTTILHPAIFEKKQFEKIRKQHESSNTQEHKKLLPNHLHKEKCREVAKRLWEKDPNITIADMIFCNEINIVFESRKKQYADKTLRDWIKDLCPNRKPGRPKKK